MDASRHGEQFIAQFDLPGVDRAPSGIDVEQMVLTVKAERRPTTGDEVEVHLPSGYDTPATISQQR